MVTKRKIKKILIANRGEIAVRVIRAPQAGYVVFVDSALHEMAAQMPATRDAFRRIAGVGERKLEQYAEPFLAEIRAFRDQH